MTSDPGDELIEYPIHFSKRQFDALSKVALAQKTTVADLVLHAADIFLDVQSEETIVADPQLQTALAKMELRLIRLMAKSIQLSGQNLYFSSLPYMAGPPKARLNEEGVKFHWERSQAMAASIVKPRPANTSET